jgi:transcriptional regulator of acetoin/glycerol metabolism
MPTSRSLNEAREHMLATGAVPERLAGAVRPEVLRSWRRSLRSGADVATPQLVYKGEHESHARLRRAADPVLSRLADQLAGLSAGVLLADNEATLVERWVPDQDFLTLLDRIRADSGFDNSEPAVGTNGTGSAVELGAAFQVTGAEHFNEALQAFTCVGVPIRHPITRRLEGVITMTCRAAAANPLLTPLMTSTALEVEGRLLSEATAAERELLDVYLRSSRRGHRPVAVVGEGLVIAGPQVTDLLEGIDRALLWDTAHAAARDDRALAQLAASAPGLEKVLRCTPVETDGSVLGALVEFDLGDTYPPPRLAPIQTAVSLPGKSQAAAQVVAHATRLASRGVPVLVQGEPGVGKLTLAYAVLRAAGVPPDQVSVLDVSNDWEAGAAHFVTQLRREFDAAAPAVVMRHVDLLSSEAAAACSAVLESAPTTTRVVATMTTGSSVPPLSPGMRRLVDTIGVGRVTVPPLRERRDDIATAANGMAAKYGRDRGVHLGADALRCLVRAPWPGNMRQLEATVRGAVLASPSGEIRPSALPLELQTNPQRHALSPIEELELSAIMDALRKHRGNKQAAAAEIGISRSTLYRKLRAYRIDPDADFG